MDIQQAKWVLSALALERGNSSALETVLTVIEAEARKKMGREPHPAYVLEKLVQLEEDFTLFWIALDDLRQNRFILMLKDRMMNRNNGECQVPRASWALCMAYARTFKEWSKRDIDDPRTARLLARYRRLFA